MLRNIESPPAGYMEKQFFGLEHYAEAGTSDSAVLGRPFGSLF